MSQQSVNSLKGIGDKTAALFDKLGVITTDDLLVYYPKGYDTYEAPVKIENLSINRVVSVEGIVIKTAEVKKLQNLQLVTASIRDAGGILTIVWYNMPFLRTTIRAGARFVFRGMVLKKNGRLTLEQPEIFSLAAYDELINSMQPIYGQTKGLGNKVIVKAIAQVLEHKGVTKEYLPASMRTKYELAEYKFAMEHIHFPIDKVDLLFARKRLVFDEFFLFLLSVRFLKDRRIDKRSVYDIVSFQKSEEVKTSLPYALTSAQERVWNEIKDDLSGGFVMNRLIQGDVGSGKTIIAILTLLAAAGQGLQGALMVPTEVLAKQHFESMAELFKAQGIEKRPVLVTGSMTAKEKRIAYEKIADHEVDIIIGTHALIQEKIVYDKLALVITDEQHRFGVKQREALGEKGGEPHVLVMSATPIPRTLAIIIYGDLDISIIDELPSNRVPIKNCVVGIDYRKKAYEFIGKEVEAGRQAYVICPMVEESEMIEAENVLDYTKLLKEELPSIIKIEALHGKMKPKDKNLIMERFAANEIQVLVSTTVVEVGVNVPNATVMMIENSERFGLAQLHQLRGRVGRGNHQSYCILVSGSDSKETKQRLEILNKSNDGFYIASEDLKLRGPGDIFGRRQSGLMEFKIGDIFTDADLLKVVSEEVNLLLDEDPALEKVEHRELKKKLNSYLEKGVEKLNL